MEEGLSYYKIIFPLLGSCIFHLTRTIFIYLFFLIDQSCTISLTMLELWSMVFFPVIFKKVLFYYMSCPNRSFCPCPPSPSLEHQCNTISHPPTPLSLSLLPDTVCLVLCWGLWFTWTWVLCRIIDMVYLHSSKSLHPVRTASFAEDDYDCVCVCLYDFFIKNQVSIGMCVYVLVFDLIPFINLSVFIPIPDGIY